MIQSMTAFARNQATLDELSITLELRSVNHRYLDISIRAPEEVREIEQALRNLLSEKLGRGKVELNIRTQMNPLPENNRELEINTELVKQLSNACETISKNLAKADKVNLLDVLRWPGVVQAQQTDTKALQQTAIACLTEALEEFIANRKREGEKLAAMLVGRCDEMEKIVSQVEEVIPTIIQARKQKIMDRLAEFDVEHDDKRIEQEMVLLAQKMDVSEETDRLGAHLSEVRNVLKQNKPVGRRLDFLMQELNREANTLGSKSADTETTRASVDLKVLIEQMREQVQNIE
ncbi:Protein YicC [hydrothermal vent metagenome]|uniref:Protein YicC n=1 Tax=hydrothermal vent metagenome TaxID=652676 RepID=A0A3B1ABU3_9ZZZZ